MAYAAVISLLKILEDEDELPDPEQFQNIHDHYPRSEVLNIRSKLLFLKEFLVANPSGGDLEEQIREAVYKAEDVFDSYLANSARSSKSASSFTQGLLGVISDIDSIAASIRISPRAERPTSSPQEPSRYGKLIVGRDAELNRLTARLMSESKALETIPILGISGIGKTLLADSVYDDPEIASTFRWRGKVKVSMYYSKRDVLMGLLRSIMGTHSSGKGQEITEEQLAKRLSGYLRSGKYLILLDDVCNLEALANLKGLFPDYNYGSRVMLTTREEEVAESAKVMLTTRGKEVAESANNGGLSFEEIFPLKEEESWNLLQSVVFRPKSCPNELEFNARRVSDYCRGLPFAIVNIGKVLREAGRKDWEIAASSLSDCGSKFVELQDTVMLLNYKTLRQYAKPCLLYMGIFPNNYDIPVSKLLRLWIAEGFIGKTESFQSLEKMAEECLEQLVKREILAFELSPIGKMRTCRIDGIYYEFFKNKAVGEKFFHVVDRYTSRFPHENWNQGRFCILSNVRFASNDELRSRKPVPTVRSLLFGGAQEQFPLWVHLDFKYLRVLDALKIRFYSFPEEILNLVNLRYLALTYNGVIPESICKLWYLQFLIVLHLSSKISEDVSRLPVGIWKTNQLRHLQVMGRDLPLPDSSTSLLLDNLLTLLDVSSHSCTLEIFQRVPNLKKLGVRIESPVLDGESPALDGESPALDGAANLSFPRHLIALEHLESFKCVVMHPDFSSQVVSTIPPLPTTLTKISLSGCGLCWDEMKVIATLPVLVSLKLRWHAFRGAEWKQGGGDGRKEFPRLKLLLLEDLDIVLWEASGCQFPSLTNLVIRHCYKLQEIPTGIGRLLKKIELVECKSSTVKSAQMIKEEQKSKGYVQADLQSLRDD